MLTELVSLNYKLQISTIILILGFFFTIILFHFWYSERKLYSKLLDQMNYQTTIQKTDLIICPECKGFQQYGLTHCRICYSEWILCKECFLPFEKGSSVLIAPCCGEGFHPIHFESALREKGFCPNCHSIDVLSESNW